MLLFTAGSQQTRNGTQDAAADSVRYCRSTALSQQDPDQCLADLKKKQEERRKLRDGEGKSSLKLLYNNIS